MKSYRLSITTRLQIERLAQILKKDKTKIVEQAIKELYDRIIVEKT